jgi:hypothetical protein
VLGLTSSFAYDSSGEVDAMTTPYGTTQFAYDTTAAGPPRFLNIVEGKASVVI